MDFPEPDGPVIYNISLSVFVLGISWNFASLAILNVLNPFSVVLSGVTLTIWLLYLPPIIFAKATPSLFKLMVYNVILDYILKQILYFNDI